MYVCSTMYFGSGRLVIRTRRLTLNYLKKGYFFIKFYSVACFMDKFSFMLRKFRNV